MSYGTDPREEKVERVVIASARQVGKTERVLVAARQAVRAAAAEQALERAVPSVSDKTAWQHLGRVMLNEYVLRAIHGNRVDELPAWARTRASMMVLR